MAQVAIVTGSSSGIGKATVECFLQHGWVVYGFDIQKPSISHDDFISVSCDVTNIDAINHAISDLIQSVQHVDALVCNAGVHFSATILESTEEDFQRLIDINIKHHFFMTQKILPYMLHQKKGSIVYVGSDQTLVGKKHSALYGLTKSALNGLAKTTAIDYADQGIRANVVAAGTVETALYHHAVEKHAAESGKVLADIHHAENQEQPIGRIGQPEEVARLIYFLCSDDSAFITGAVIPIDGGYTAR